MNGNVRKYSKILDAESTEGFQTQIDTDFHGFDILWPDTFNSPSTKKLPVPSFKVLCYRRDK